MKKLEKTSSVCTDVMSVSHMDTSGLRLAAHINRIHRKDHRDWKKVTAITMEDMHSDSQFFDSNPARPLPFFDAKGKEKLRWMHD
jgi:hypothetical protein